MRTSQPSTRPVLAAPVLQASVTKPLECHRDGPKRDQVKEDEDADPMNLECLREPTRSRQSASAPADEIVLAPDKQRALVVSSLYSSEEMSQRIGREAYSYRFVFDAFAPLLERWGRTFEVTQAESRL